MGKLLLCLSFPCFNSFLHQPFPSLWSFSREETISYAIFEINVMGLFIQCIYTENAPSTGDMHNRITRFLCITKVWNLFPLLWGFSWLRALHRLCHYIPRPAASWSQPHEVLPLSCRLAIWLRENLTLHLVHNMLPLPCCLQAAITIVKCPISPPHHHWISIWHGYRHEGSCPCKLPFTQNRVIRHNTDPCLCTVLQPWPFIFLWWAQAN